MNDERRLGIKLLVGIIVSYLIMYLLIRGL
jgi:hypothetical protein